LAPKILYAWELGANLGHVGQFAPLGRRLKRGGALVDCALAFTAGVAPLLRPHGLGWLQAPVFRGAAPADLAVPPLSYADILLTCGYASPEDLVGLVGAWRRLIALTGATLVLADHAPTAILAARTMGTPVMLHGTGFYAPPNLRPTPAMRPWAAAHPAALEGSERRALETLNLALQAFDAEPLGQVSQLFDVAEPGLMTFPEIDAYPRRRGGRYWGMPPSFGAAPFEWPAGEGPRLFTYLRASHPATEAVLTAIQQSRSRAVVFCPDLSEAWRARLATSNASVLTGAVDLEQAGREADAAILHASHGTTAALLRYGVPMLMIPGNLEQGLVAYRVEALGAGVTVGRPGRFDDPAAALATLLASPDYAARAKAFALRHAGAKPEVVLELMALRALALAGAGP
jgi:UDP:flavonoid glycosyltransferase YjiC (YdhE family)